MKNKQLPFWIFTFSVFIALLLPSLAQNGMFLDGLVNSSIARNMSQGVGSFWALQYSSSLCSPFYDQLPFAMWLQSLFFDLLGDHLYVERIYCFLAAAATAFFMIKIWRLIFRNQTESASLSWYPVLLWIITPVVFWSYSNNMLDNTMAVFDLAAIYLIIKALATNKYILLRLSLAGASILAAFLSKGPIGLYPLACVFIYWLFFKNQSFGKSLIYSLFLLLVPVVLLSLLLETGQNAVYSFTEYFGQQIIQSIAGKRDLGSGRFFIVERLLSELILMAALSFLIFAVSKIKNPKIITNPANRRSFLFILTVALSGSLPIITSLKQSGYYLVSSLPFFAMAAGIVISPRLGLMINKFGSEIRRIKIAALISGIFFCMVLIFSFLQAGKILRDKDLVHEITVIGEKVPHNCSITVCPEMMQDWGLHAYMMRYFTIKLDFRKPYEYYISSSTCQDTLIKNFTKVSTDTRKYELYKRKN